MRPAKARTLTLTLGAVTLVLGSVAASPGRGNEPGRFGRLFRFGGPAPADVVTTQPPPPRAVEPPTRGPVGLDAAPTEPTGAAANPPASPKLVPQPRVSRPVTEADPIVTRISLGRSDDGGRFGMFLQVFADGTVIDSEGVHPLGREGVKDVVQALESGELYRVKGHCGGPSTDFVESVHLVVYERSLGRLRANAFSFSGNTQGCDHSVHRLQTALDALQAKLSRPAPGPSLSASAPVSAPALAPAGPPSAGSSAPIRLNAPAGH